MLTKNKSILLHTRFKREDRDCTDLGIQASAMKTRSMLQAMTGIWGTQCMSVGAWVGLPSVSSKSRSSWRLDSQWVGSPISNTASTRGKSGFSLYCPLACKQRREHLLSHAFRDYDYHQHIFYTIYWLWESNMFAQRVGDLNDQATA